MLDVDMSPFAIKKHTFRYHHVGKGDKCKAVYYHRNWLDCVNMLMDDERGSQIFIDYVEVEELNQCE